MMSDDPKSDNFFQILGRILDDCADEMGIAGCSGCNVRGECDLFWERVDKSLATGKTLRAHKYIEFVKEFQKIRMKKEKQCICTTSRPGR